MRFVPMDFDTSDCTIGEARVRVDRSTYEQERHSTRSTVTRGGPREILRLRQPSLRMTGEGAAFAQDDFFQ